MCEGVWNGFLLGQAKKEEVPCWFCGKRDGDGHLLLECTDAPNIWTNGSREDFLFKVGLRWLVLVFYLPAPELACESAERGSSAPDPLVWDQGSKGKHPRTENRVNINLASLPRPLGFLSGPWVQVHGGCITGSDVVAWPYSVSILCKFTVFCALCIGMQVMWIWDTLGFLILRF